MKSNKLIKIVTLMCFHNRKKKTISSISDLYNQKIEKDICLKFCVVDDGSTDGTSKEIIKKFSDIEILKGNGNLFWAGGMRFGFEHSTKMKNFDYLFLYNDDIELFPNALQNLVNTSKEFIKVEGVKEHIVVGSFKDKKKQISTYGGLVKSNYFHPLKFSLLEPQKTKYEFVDTLNMNACLISKSTIRKIGFLNREFIHSGADIDYGLTLNKHGGKVILCKNYVGYCSRNTSSDKFIINSGNIFKAYKEYTNKKRAPIKQRYLLLKKHGGFFYIIFFILPFLLFPFRYILLKYLK